MKIKFAQGFSALCLEIIGDGEHKRSPWDFLRFPNFVLFSRE
jgi:hypothetical protein